MSGRYAWRLLGAWMVASAGCSDDALTPAEQADYPTAGLFTPGSLLGAQAPPDGGGPDGSVGLSPEELAALEDTIANAGKENRCLGVEGTPGTPGLLTASFQTASYDGFYAPENCGAVWIEDAAGTYVATPLVWAQIRVRNLFVWDALRCRADWPPDVVSSATLDDHTTTHEMTWDGMEHRGARVPDGDYVLKIEVTEDEFNYGRLAEYPFVWGAAAFTLNPDDKESVKDLQIDFTPMP